jgi:phytoene dehydrogenase-like protein
MLLSRLPKLRDPHTSPERAFTGTFYVNEGYEQLQRAYAEADAGRIPTLPPAELYCHSLTDPSILSPELRDSGTHALTLFGLHMPARLFAADPVGAKQAAVAATLASVSSVLAEPLEECLAVDADGVRCLEAHTPPDLERELAMPGGHIFHRDLSWPFAETEEEVGRWGVETRYPNVWLCGSGARRGGCVSGIAGHNAARAVLASDSRS